MPVKVEGRRIIRAPVQKVFQLVSRLDAAPRVTGLWFTADLVERTTNALTVHYRGYFAGIPIESVQRATLHPPNRIDFRQTRGHLKALRGQYQLKPIEGDTEIALALEAEVGITLISEAAARLVLHAFIERSLEKFKLTAERDLPRVVRKAADGAAAREPAPAEAAETEAATANGGPAAPVALLPEGPPAPPPERRPSPPPRRGRAQAPPHGEAKPAQSGGERKRHRRRRRRRGGRGGGGTPGGGASGPEGRGAGESGSSPGGS